MITPPSGWVVERRQSGLIMVPPEGISCGVICYQDHHQPLRPVVEIVASLPSPSGWATRGVSEIERLVTVEGEHAALVTLTGTLDGAPAERTVGVVFTDASYTTSVGLARRPDQFERFREAVRNLVVNDTFMLGTRRRRFVHIEPAGWHGFLDGPMHARFLPIDYPRNAAMLTVFPALPIPAGERSHAEQFAVEHATRLEADQVTDCGPASSTAGLSGSSWRVFAPTDPEIVHDVVVLEDHRHIYPIVLETLAEQREQNLTVLSRVVESIEPIPDPARPSPQTCADIFSNWIN